MLVDYKYMEFVATGKCPWLDGTLTELTCGDLEILFAIIRLGVTGLKKTRFVCPQDFSFFFWGGGGMT